MNAYKMIKFAKLVPVAEVPFVAGIVVEKIAMKSKSIKILASEDSLNEVPDCAESTIDLENMGEATDNGTNEVSFDNHEEMNHEIF